MADPRPWLESDESTPIERELLLREERARPDPALRQEVWTALLAALPPLGSPDGGGGGVAPPTGGADAGAAGAAIGAGAMAKLSTAAIVKPFVIGLLSGGVAMTAVELATDPSDEPRARPAALAPASTASAPLAPTNRVAAEHAAPLPSAATRAERTSPSSPLPAASAIEPEPARESSLRAERSALTRARAALQAGNASEALSILDTAVHEIEKPVLGQEREVVYIQALAGAGRAAEARQRASRFLTAFPDSPHSAIVRRFGDD